MADPPHDFDGGHPMGAAMQWVARIFGAAVMMILPGLAGLWLDDRFGWSFIGLIGFAFGLIGGMTYLISATRAADAERRQATQLPATQLLATQLPATQLPATQLPATQLPATQLPATQLPATQLPATQLPATGAQKTVPPGKQDTPHPE